jgi:hypothetical protein
VKPNSVFQGIMAETTDLRQPALKKHRMEEAEQLRRVVAESKQPEIQPEGGPPRRIQGTLSIRWHR